jgi:hypothetical protein
MLSDKVVFLEKDRVLEMFHGRQQLEVLHREIIAMDELTALMPEDFD